MSEYKPKLIEVALPLAAINAAAAAEGSIGQRPHPKNLHRWWARRPLPAARAVIWASLVDDPSGDHTLTTEEIEVERQRLFAILERLVAWKDCDNTDVLDEARRAIDRSFPDGAPPILDPFAGGGAIPLEAQRLGLTVLAGDLNPVAVLINRAMLEIPRLFDGLPPVHSDTAKDLTTWEGAQGLAADVEAYGQWMRDEAERRIGHLYADATSPNGERLTPLAWIWARTVESPDPAWSGHVPLVASWVLANKSGKPTVWVEPVIDRKDQTVSYAIREGGEPLFERTVDQGRGICIATGAALTYEYIRHESLRGRMNQSLMAVVAQGSRYREYCSATAEDIKPIANISDPAWRPDSRVGDHPRNISPPLFGLDEWWKLFTPRQLIAMVTFSDLLHEVADHVRRDAQTAGMSADPSRLRSGGQGACAYADAVVTYLAFVVDKFADFCSSVCSWNSRNSQIRNVFARQAIPMAWDFVEVNPFSRKVASWDSHLRVLVRALSECFRVSSRSSGVEVRQRDARSFANENATAFLSTDPPYYDNISYADLSDFFFVWLRRNLSDIWPDECAILLTPKDEEMISNRYRAGSKSKAKDHFESGMADFMAQAAVGHPAEVPMSIYYAYKATESASGQTRMTGWSSFLQAVLDAGLQVNATWPLRTERAGRSTSIGSNSLASSIVLACRPRDRNAPLASRGEFLASLRDELPRAVRVLQSGNIAPVDMAQSAIGPGMKVFSRYAKVVEADGSAMSVSSALAIINDALGEILDGEEAELDAPTRFALTWFSQHGFDPAASGDADNLARAKNTSLAGIEESGVGVARAGEFRLYERSELAESWSPMDDARLTVWEATQYLVKALERSETKAAALLQQLGGYGNRARQLAYLLFQKASDNGWASEASMYNGLITAWPALRSADVIDDTPLPSLQKSGGGGGTSVPDSMERLRW